jgi:D-inositol-3-phosphate glycosyltransferase
VKIVSVGPLAPHRGGISHYHTLLCRSLAHTHDVLGLGFTRLYPDLLFPGKTQLDESAQAIDFPNERVIDSVDPRTWRRAARRVREHGALRLVFQWWHPFFAPAYAGVAALARRRGSRPRVVFVCHNVRPHEGSRANDAVLMAAYRMADAFVVHAESERNALAPLVGERPIAVHAHPPYDVFAADGAPSRDDAKRTLGLSGDVLLFFGLVRAYKGLMTLLEALPSIVQERPVTLVVAGEFYDARAPYDARIRELGIADRIRIHDRYIPNEDVQTYFAAADVVVQPYVHATQSGISQIAFAFGRPVIATNTGGLKESILHGETGFLVPPEDPQALTHAVVRFFADAHGPAMERAIRARLPPTWDGLADVVARV